VKHNYYYKHIGDLKRRLGEAVPREELRDLHRVSAVRHFLTVGRLVLMVLLCGWGLWQSRYPWLWVPAALVQGCNVLGFIILLHEQVHKVIFEKSRPRLERLLGLLYGMPSFVSTLAGLLAILGMQLYVLGATGSINLPYGSPPVNFRWLTLRMMIPLA